MVITIADEWGGWPVLIYRMDGTPYGYIEVSRDRAWTAVAFRVSSDSIMNEVGIEYGVCWNERLTVTAGGIPFKLQVHYSPLVLPVISPPSMIRS
ncbi:heme-binding protein [Vulcanisaeta souniana]|uniref:GlcG/HbpS family heme-binding protein n=1 Tax=Vulcanisaeta souniana TaxID=164452 RepID=UPI001FB26C0F|nr:heme-binding protein [Vulcanisaeta souniana]